MNDLRLKCVEKLQDVAVKPAFSAVGVEDLDVRGVLLATLGNNGQLDISLLNEGLRQEFVIDADAAFEWRICGNERDFPHSDQRKQILVV